AVLEGEGRENDDARNHVHDDAAQHHEQALPGGLAPELVGLRRASQRVGILRFIDHAVNGHVAAQRKPADAVLTARDSPGRTEWAASCRAGRVALSASRPRTAPASARYFAGALLPQLAHCED
nr:hypothetical protein [Tanacetum cinerariifolium]